jgi:Leucine-rich repeat (LRR) protein
MINKLIALFFFIPLFTFSQNVNIPDANFKAYLIQDSTINTNRDTAIQVTEAESFSGSIICRKLNITDLTGIEFFTSLTYLDCDTNELTSLNISNNLKLTILRCGSNQITSLDLSKNIALTFIHCSDNQLSSLELSTNKGLIYLGCYLNKLDSLNVASNTALASLLCGANKLTYLDVSANSALTALDCSRNQLIFLDLRNGNNINMWWAQAALNPLLKCISVDDVSWSTANWKVENGRIDQHHSFSSNCDK